MGKVYSLLDLLTPTVVLAVTAHTTPSSRAVELVSQWRQLGIVDFTQGVDVDRNAICGRLNTNKNHLRGAIDLTSGVANGDSLAQTYLDKASVDGKSVYSQMIRWRKAGGTSGTRARKAGPKKQTTPPAKRKKRETTGSAKVPPHIEEVKQKLMHLLKPDKSYSNKDLQLWAGCSSEDYGQAKRSLRLDGYINISRGRNGRVARTKKSLRETSCYPADKQVSRPIAPEVSSPPTGNQHQQMTTDLLKEAASLQVPNAVLKYCSNFNTLLTVLKHRLLEERSEHPESDLELLEFASEKISAILQQIISPSEKEV